MWEIAAARCHAPCAKAHVGDRSSAVRRAHLAIAASAVPRPHVGDRGARCDAPRAAPHVGPRRSAVRRPSWVIEASRRPTCHAPLGDRGERGSTPTGVIAAPRHERETRSAGAVDGTFGEPGYLLIPDTPVQSPLGPPKRPMSFRLPSASLNSAAGSPASMAGLNSPRRYSESRNNGSWPKFVTDVQNSCSTASDS